MRYLKTTSGILLGIITLLTKMDIPAPLFYPSRNHSQWLKTFPGEHAGEGRTITCEYDGFYLVNVYVPNSKNDLSRLDYRYECWDPDLRNYLLTLREKKPVILCGDLNVAHQEIDLANPTSNHNSAGFTDEEREGMSNLLAGLDTYLVPIKQVSFQGVTGLVL